MFEKHDLQLNQLIDNQDKKLKEQNKTILKLQKEDKGLETTKKILIESSTQTTSEIADIGRNSQSTSTILIELAEVKCKLNQMDVAMSTLINDTGSKNNPPQKGPHTKNSARNRAKSSLKSNCFSVSLQVKKLRDPQMTQHFNLNETGHLLVESRAVSQTPSRILKNCLTTEDLCPMPDQPTEATAGASLTPPQKRKNALGTLSVCSITDQTRDICTNNQLSSPDTPEQHSNKITVEAQVHFQENYSPPRQSNVTNPYSEMHFLAKLPRKISKFKQKYKTRIFVNSLHPANRPT